MLDEHPLPPGDTDTVERAMILADPRQRRILSLLMEKAGPMSEHDLAVQLATRERETLPSNIPEDTYREIQLDLHHNQIPKLEATGWVERHPEGVVVSDQFSLEGMPFPELEDPDLPTWDALATVLAYPRRQLIASIIADRSDPLSLNELGVEMAALKDSPWRTDGGEEEPILLTTLHHVDLPNLATVDLIEYDSGEKTITGKQPLVTLVDRTDVGSKMNEADGHDS